MKQIFKVSQGLVAVSLIATNSFSMVALAHKDSGSGGSGSTDTHVSMETETHSVDEIEEETGRPRLKLEAERLRREGEKEHRLDEAKKRLCLQKEANLAKHTTNFISHVERQLTVFDGIQQRVDAFAVRKNLTTENKAVLLASVKTARDKVTTDLAQLKSDAEAFKCDSSNPKGQLGAFSAGAKLVRADLKAYRTTIRQYIQGVRKANGQQKAEADSTTESNKEKTQ